MSACNVVGTYAAMVRHQRVCDAYPTRAPCKICRLLVFNWFHARRR